MKFNLIYFYTSSCQFKEQQQSNHLRLISSIHCRWSREQGFWTEAEHVAMSQPRLPLPHPQALCPGGMESWWPDSGVEGSVWSGETWHQGGKAGGCSDTNPSAPPIVWSGCAIVGEHMSPVEQGGKLSLKGVPSSVQTEPDPGLFSS